MKSTKIAAISLLIAAALLFLLAGFMPFATLDDKQSDTEETTQLEDMTFYIMNSLTTRSLGTVLSTGMFTILLLISIGSVFLALSDKTKKFVLLCISVFAALTIYSLTAMAASYRRSNAVFLFAVRRVRLADHVAALFVRRGGMLRCGSLGV